jgi:hypothetical protein
MIMIISPNEQELSKGFHRSVLGPLLFIIYIYLPLCINKFANVFLFVDDTSSLVTEKNHCALTHKVADTFSLIVNWFIANKLAFNINKTNIIILLLNSLLLRTTGLPWLYNQ